MPLTIPLSEIGPDDLPRVGAKAHSLATLLAAGVVVPPGFAVTAEALQRFLDASGLGADLAKIEEQARSGGLPLTESWDFLGETRGRIAAAPLPADVRGEVLRAYRLVLGDDDPPVAVRSSGLKEDLEDASFAGQYETFLNVRGEAALEDALKRCWASIWRNRVLQYSHHRAGGAAGLRMSVIVQRLVAADVSGVLFTVSPVTGREREMLVEACFGLGEALVSGRVTPDVFVVDARTGEALSTQVASKARKVVPLPGGKTEEVPLEPDAARAPTLGAEELRALAALGASVQEHYGRPMDIEWALASGRLHALQARPITKLSFAPDFGEWTTADFKDGGVAADVCSPFMHSLYELCFQHSMPRYFEEIKLLRKGSPGARWIGLFFARPYWNLGEVKRVLERIPGYDERNFDTDLGIAPTYEGSGRRTPVTLLGVLSALPVLFALKRSYRERLAADRAFAASFAERKRPFDLPPAEIAALEGPTFARRFRELIERFYFETETAYFFTIYNTSNSKLDFKPHFDKANAACGGQLSYLALVSGLEDLSHLRPVADLYDRLARLRREGRGALDVEVRAFAARWGYHGKKVLDIRVPRWGEDLPYVRSLFEGGLAGFEAAQDPRAQARRQHEQYEAERAKAERALRFRPFARRAFREGLALVRTYAWWREEMRDHSTFAYSLVRRFALDAGRRLAASGALDAADEVFHLPFQEALAAVDGAVSPAEVRARAQDGRRLLRSFRSFQNPGEIGSRYRFEEGAAPAAAAPGALRGTACSPGRVTGRAAVVRSLDEAKKVQQGDVLVTVFTDPGWTPLLGMVSAVVTETGGLLSHAAVISREYGIPAVLAVAGATRAVEDGDRVLVDGSAGTVEVLARKGA